MAGRAFESDLIARSLDLAHALRTSPARLSLALSLSSADMGCCEGDLVGRLLDLVEAAWPPTFLTARIQLAQRGHGLRNSLSKT
jgi:hypothetical protein